MKITISELRELVQEAKKTEGGDYLLAKPPLTEGCGPGPAAISDAPGHEAALSHDTASEEGRMAQSQLYQAMKNVGALSNMLDDDEDLPSWVQAKITKAADYIRAAKEYIEYEKQEPHGGAMMENQLDQLGQYVKQFVNGQLKESDDETNAALNKIIGEELKGININDPAASDFKELKDTLESQEEKEITDIGMGEETPSPRAGPPALTQNDKQYEDDPDEDRVPGTSQGTLRGGVTE